MLVYVRPSNEALLRARVPGAQDQCGCPSHHSDRARSASKRGTWPLLIYLHLIFTHSQEEGLAESPDCARLSHPPTHWHAGTCH
jgi:hypothetical protein